MIQQLKFTKQLLRNKSLIILLILCGIFLVKIFLLTKLNGFGWEADEYMHFLEAKTLFTNFPHNLNIGIGVWSKPGYIYLYGLVIMVFGITNLFPVQILTILLTLLTSYLVLKILEVLKCNFQIQILGLVLTNFSFLMLRGSLSIMTEPIFALFLIAGIYFLLKKKFKLSSLMFGLLPLVRIEGLFFVVIFIVYLIYDLRLKKFINFKSYFLNLILLLLPTIIWDFFGFLMTGRIFYIIDSGYPLTVGKYGHGGYPYYLEGFFKLDPLIITLFMISAVYIFKYFRNKKWIEFGIIFSFSLFFLLQVLFWKFGLFGTAGLMRYFITVIPLAIISICLFFNEILVGLKSRIESSLIIIMICILQVIFSGLIFTRGGLIFNQQTRSQIEPGITEAGDWLRSYVKADEKIYADVPEVIYFANRDLNNATIFGVDDAFNNKEKAVYIFKKSSERSEDFFKELKGSEVVNFDNNVYIVRP
ncbi:MAG: hypothetical protein ABI721_04835 [Candidatus Dojkabacteria bacterium]